jgi:cytochrome c oxidase subunit 2
MKFKWGLLAGCFLLVCPPLLLNSSTTDQTPRKIEVTASRFSYAPKELTLKKGEPVVLVLKSTDTTHGFRISELNVDIKADKGKTAEAEFTPDKAGDFVAHCSVFCGEGHGSMELTLHVEE